MVSCLQEQTEYLQDWMGVSGAFSGFGRRGYIICRSGWGWSESLCVWVGVVSVYVGSGWA